MNIKNNFFNLLQIHPTQFRLRTGTFNSIQNLTLNILYQRDIRLTDDDSHTPMDLALKTWWNGLYVAILQKT